MVEGAEWCSSWWAGFDDHTHDDNGDSGWRRLSGKISVALLY